MRSARALPSTRSIAATLLQVTLAGVVLYAPGRAGPPAYWHYGIAILLGPLLIWRVCWTPPRPFHRVWLSVGLALHPLGAIYGAYGLWWYDHVTHLLSASLVVAGGYALGRSLPRVLPGRHPRWLLHAGTFLLIVGGGVAWEVYELHVSHLTVYGVEDTVKDLLFNLTGWAVVAAFHRPLLGHLPRDLTARAVAYTGHTRPLPE